MAVLNLRNVPDELAAYLKSEAALAGISLRDYCVAIFKARGEVWPIYSLDDRTGAVSVITNADMRISKKIAEISAGGVGAESGGTPDLPRLGKAQNVENYHAGPHLLTGRDGDTAFCNPQSCKWCAEGLPEIGEPDTDVEMTTAELGRVGKIFGAGRRALPDGVPCGHAGCLSHLSHPCEGCGRIGGRRPIYNMEDNAVAQKNRGGSVPSWVRKMKKWLDGEMGDLNLAPKEMLEEMKEDAKTSRGVAVLLHTRGVELDRDILVRWGLAENYKPFTFENQRGVPGSDVVVNRNQVRPLVDKNKSEGVAVRLEKTSGSGTTFMAAKVPEATGNLEDEVGGGKIVEGNQGGESGATAGKNRRVAKGLPKNDDGGKSIAVGVGKPGIDIQALRDICARNIPDLVGETLTKEEVDAPDFGEVDLCGFKSYNEIDGENYVCGKEVHEYPKVKHGDWIKI